MRNSFLFFVLAVLSTGSTGAEVFAGKLPASIPVKLVQITLAEEADLALPEAGRLTEVPAQEGKTYQQDEILTRLDDKEAELLHNRAKAEFSIAEEVANSDINIRFAVASSEVANARLKRGQISFERYKNSISEAELDEYRLAAKEAELKIEQAQHEHRISQLTLEIKRSELQLAEVQLEKKRIRAPFPGVVVRVDARKGEWVEKGNPVVRIVRLDKLLVQGFIGAEYLPASIDGKKVRITIPRENGSEMVIESTVAFVSPEVNPINKQRPVWAEIENKDLALSPGMKGEMVILTGNSGTSKR